MVKSLSIKYKRHFVNTRAVWIVNNALRLIEVTKHSNLAFVVVAKFNVFACSTNDYVWIKTKRCKFLDTMLSRLGLDFASRLQVWNKRAMDV